MDVVYWLKSGFLHVIPQGYDHVLFILCLFFLSQSRWFVIKATAVFTLAHSFSLIFAAMGWVQVRASFVEPIIALSIFVTAMAILFDKGASKLTYGIVFCFGLIHGLGFASVLLEEQLPKQTLMWTVLFFNIGVELAQTTIILVAWLLVAIPFEDKTWYKKWVVYPYATIAGTAALLMFFNRI